MVLSKVLYDYDIIQRFLLKQFILYHFLRLNIPKAKKKYKKIVIQNGCIGEHNFNFYYVTVYYTYNIKFQLLYTLF